jgi:hypothetical protein
MDDSLPIEIDHTNTTVASGAARRVAELMVAGHTMPEAAREAGVTRTNLNAMKESVRAQIRLLLDTWPIDEDIQRDIAKARLTEFLLSPDPDLAMKAVQEVRKTPLININLNERPAAAERAWKIVEAECAAPDPK